jgi:hypothetical protein
MSRQVRSEMRVRGVEALSEPKYLIEIDAIAVID